MALSNRQLLLNERKKKRTTGLPAPIDDVVTTPRQDFSKKVDRGLPVKTGFQGKQRRAEQADIEQAVAGGTATEGMKDVQAGLEEKFPKFFKPKAEVIGEEVDTGGMPSNVSIAPARVERPKTDRGFSFGLPTDRLPSFAELGGAIGQMFKHLGGIAKKRQALGLIPGKVNVPTLGKGLSLTQKDRATILAKRLEDLTLTPDEKTTIKSELDAILNPHKATEATDIEDILAL